jgi:hypothetical protein
MPRIPRAVRRDGVNLFAANLLLRNHASYAEMLKREMGVMESAPVNLYAMVNTP